MSSSTQTKRVPPTLAATKMPVLLRLLHSETWVGPAWAVLCGTLASSNWRFAPASIARLFLTAFLAQVLWIGWRTGLVETNWRTVIGTYPVPAPGTLTSTLPYLLPGSPAGRALRLGDRLLRWRHTLPFGYHSTLIAIGALPPLILSLSALIDWRVTALSLAAIALALIEWRVSWHGNTHRALCAGTEIGLSWLAGHVIWAPLKPLSLVFACCYAIAYQGMLAHLDPRTSRHRLGELAFLEIGQLAALVAVMLTATSGALLAGTIIGLLLAPQVLLLNHPEAAVSPRSYVRRAVPYLMISMSIAAWVT
jgi:hypothetical protein